jgi:hypothetical protein
MSQRILFGLFLFPAVAVLSSTPITAADDETYNLRGPAPKKGDIIVYETKETDKDAVRKLKSGDNTTEDRFDEIVTKRKEIEILAVNGNEITRTRTKVLKDSTEEIRQKGKRTFQRTTPNKLDGQYIYSDLTKNGWKHSLEDTAPNDEQKKALADYQPFKIDDVLLPEGKVKIGHEWKIDAAQFQKLFGTKIRDVSGGGTGKFTKVEKDGDDQVAILEIDFDIAGKMNDDGVNLDLKLAAKGTTRRSLKTGYDLSSKSEGKLSLKGKGEIEGEKIEVEYSSKVSEVETWKLKEAKP